MNLYFRLILVFIKSLFAGKRNPLEASVVHFRVWPLDCDVNLHLTNSRYFAFADLGKAFGGHLAPGTIVFACEFIIQEMEGAPYVRDYDEETGLQLWRMSD